MALVTVPDPALTAVCATTTSRSVTFVVEPAEV